MVQSYLVGVFFCVGLAVGVIVTIMLSTSSSVMYANVGLARSLPSANPPWIASDSNHSVQDRPPEGQAVTDTPAGVHNNTVMSPDGKVVVVHRPPLSHEEVDSIPGPAKPLIFSDGHFHKDDDELATKLYKEVRILCWIMTSPSNLRSKAVHVNATWGKRCNKILYMSDEEDKSFPAVGVKTDLGRDHLTAKTMRAFDYVYQNHLDDADWFMKADDDTYVILENMRYMLSPHAPTEPIYFGHHFKVIVRQGYFSGGAGYVLSREALKRFGGRGQGLCAEDHGAEDVEMGRCMEKLGVVAGDSRDAQGRSRFHCFDPETHLHGGYPDWYFQYDKYGAQKGIASVSDYAVTFHYVPPNKMYDLEFYIYHLHPYGIINGIQDLNRSPGSQTITTTTASPEERQKLNVHYLEMRKKAYKLSEKERGT